MALFSMNYFYGVATFLMTFLTIIGNLMIITAFIMERTLRMRPSNLLVVALSVTDLFFGLYLFVYYGITITFGLGHPFGEIGCMTTVFLEYSYIVGTLLLIAISIDRILLISVNYSRYVKMQSTSCVKLTIIACCVVGLIGALTEIGLWNYAKRNNAAAVSIDFDLYCLYPQRRMKWFALYLSIVFYVLPVFLIAILSSVFFILLRRKMRKTRQIGVSAHNSAGYPHSRQLMSVAATVNLPDSNRQTVEDIGTRNRYKKPAITLAALVSAMLISMFPYSIYLIVAAIHPELNDPDLIYTMILICQLNPLLDPLFYGATQTQIRDFYRKGMWKLIGRIGRCINTVDGD